MRRRVSPWNSCGLVRQAQFPTTPPHGRVIVVPGEPALSEPVERDPSAFVQRRRSLEGPAADAPRRSLIDRRRASLAAVPLRTRRSALCVECPTTKLRGRPWAGTAARVTAGDLGDAGWRDDADPSAVVGSGMAPGSPSRHGGGSQGWGSGRRRGAGRDADGVAAEHPGGPHDPPCASASGSVGSEARRARRSCATWRSG